MKTWKTVEMTRREIIAAEVMEAGSDPSPAKVKAQSLAARDAALSNFINRNPRSRKLQSQATQSMPGGNTRNQLYTSPFPVFMKSARGYQVTSEDDQE